MPTILAKSGYGSCGELDVDCWSRRLIDLRLRPTRLAAQPDRPPARQATPQTAIHPPPTISSQPTSVPALPTALSPTSGFLAVVAIAAAVASFSLLSVLKVHHRQNRRRRRHHLPSLPSPPPPPHSARLPTRDRRQPQVLSPSRFLRMSCPADIHVPTLRPTLDSRDS